MGKGRKRVADAGKGDEEGARKMGLLVLDLGGEVVADVTLGEGVLDEERDLVRHVEL